jgi:ligand-binding sensor domain-containing protein/signal transduction histidine kinase
MTVMVNLFSHRTGCPYRHLRQSAGLLLGCLLAGCFLVANVRAQSRFDVWTADNGLPYNGISDLLQTRDGYLWLATNDGLVRYDGVRFTTFNAGNTEGIRSNRFRSLFEDSRGNLWIAMETGGLTLYKDGLFTTYTVKDGLFEERIESMAEDEQGLLIFFLGGRLARYRQGRFMAYTPEPPIRQLTQLIAGDSGTIWYLEPNRLHKANQGSLTTFALPAGVTGVDVRSALQDRQGTLWIGTLQGKLFRFDKDKFVRFPNPHTSFQSSVRHLYEDRNGNLWLATRYRGLYRLSGGKWSHLTVETGLPSDEIYYVREDREGNVWAATGKGLVRFRDEIISAFSTRDGLATNNIYTVLEDRQGTIWLGGWHGLSRYQNGAFKTFRTKEDTFSNLITALCQERSGALWIGTYGDGLKRLKDGQITVYTEKDGLPHNIIHAIYEDRAGRLWIGTTKGLGLFQEGRFRLYTSDDGLAHNQVISIMEDRQGNLWLGTLEGLSRYRDGEFIAYSQTDGMPESTVRTIYEDQSGTLWIGTYDAGLYRLKDGKFTACRAKDGLFNNGVFQILEDARGNFWMSCNLGIYRVSKQQLNDFADGKIKLVDSVSYGKRDGLLNPECNGGYQPAGIRSRDGRLWFPTQEGVAVVEPEAVPVSDIAPPVVIEELLIDNTPAAFRDPVKILLGKESFEIHYTALSFIMAERISFKYKLVGLDTNWVEAGTRRTAYYSHVPPGRYTFLVIAANRDGIWNQQGAALTIEIVPAFWQTWWFQMLVGLSLTVAALQLFRWRISLLKQSHRAQERFSRQLIESQESERKRIANELHDGLGQSLIIIKNRTLMSLNTPDNHDRAMQQMGEISDAASQAINELKEIAHNLRPYQMDYLGLTASLRAMIGQAANSTSIQFTSSIDELDGILSEEANIGIYRIVQESINNIIKHSKATDAYIEIRNLSGVIYITIKDNGRGFISGLSATSESPGEGFGLKGIAERAKILGAKLHIKSVNGRGTDITLEVAQP